eukprot:4600111-Pleurochrysis_carterae.AAC.4
MPREANGDADRLSHPDRMPKVAAEAASAGTCVHAARMPANCWEALREAAQERVNEGGYWSKLWPRMSTATGGARSRRRRQTGLTLSSHVSACSLSLFPPLPPQVMGSGRTRETTTRVARQ